MKCNVKRQITHKFIVRILIDFTHSRCHFFRVCSNAVGMGAKRSVTMKIRQILFKQPDPAWYCAPTIPTTDSVELQYLGTAGFVIRHPERTIVLDPYLSRPDFKTTLTKPLQPNTALIQKIIPHADDVLIGHAHYDHILDAPDLCKQTGARLIGSRATKMVGLAAGLPEAQLVETNGREDIASGTWTVRGLPSIHGKALFGKVPLAGDITEPPPWPPRFHQLKHGLVLNWVVDTRGLKIVHIDSADFLNDELAGQSADVVCLCAIGRKHRPNYVRDVVRLLQPKWIVPCHWDTMITPLEDTPDLLPDVQLAEFLQEIRDAGCEPMLVPILGKLHFPRQR
jgi:L-ascorbate metabolism protein UlaG (beta-lactamase superfamily)